MIGNKAAANTFLAFFLVFLGIGLVELGNVPEIVGIILGTLGSFQGAVTIFRMYTDKIKYLW